MTRRTVSRRAFTLLEVATVMALLGVILALLGAATLGSLRTEELTAAVHHRLVAREAAAEQFRADVASASAAPKTWNDYTAGNTCLILERPDGSVLVYRWHQELLERMVVKKKESKPQIVSLGDDRAEVEFHRDADGRLLTLRLIELRGPKAVKHRLDLTAALGGDLR